MTSLNKNSSINEVRSLLKQYLITYISNYFKFNGIYLPKYFREDVEKELEGILDDFLKLSAYQKLKTKFDLLTLGELDLKDILGLDKAINLIQKSLELTFELISTLEPVDIILDLVKSKSKFLIMIEFCFQGFIINSLRKRFMFIDKLRQDKKLIVFDKVISKISENYDYYRTYDPYRSKFKTFLHKDLILIGIKVLREENLMNNILLLSSDSYQQFIDKHGICLTSPEKKIQWQTKVFFSGSELSDWLGNELEENSLRNFGKHIWPYIKNAETYSDNLVYIDETFKSTEKNLAYSEHESQVLPVSAKKNFLEKLNKIEKDPNLRLTLKIILGLDINYLNNEAHLIFDKSLSLSLVKKLHKLLLMYGIEMSKDFFNEIYFLLKEESSSFVNISANSIQRRVYRNFRKIQKYYNSYEFEDIVLSVAKTIDKSLFGQPPLFLKIIDAKDLELLHDKEFLRRLRVIDLSNCLLGEIPEEIFEIKTLEEIDLSNNMIERIPKKLKALENLKIINFMDQFSTRGFSTSSSGTFGRLSSNDLDWLRINLQNCEIFI